MWAQLQGKLFQAKKTSKARTGRYKNTRTQLRRAQSKIADQKAEIAHLRAQLAPEKVPHHTYPVQMMVLAVFIVVQGVRPYAVQQLPLNFIPTSWDGPTNSPATLQYAIGCCDVGTRLCSIRVS
jgi:hypothetical protein